MIKMNNDFLDYRENYLAHYGVLGMKWGIRRYQPYSSDAKNKGRYVGDKKEARAKARAEKLVAKTEAYKTKEIAKATKMHDRAINKATARLIKARNKYAETGKERYAKKARSFEGTVNNIKAFKKAELSEISKMTPKDVSKEKRKIGATIVASIIGSGASVALTAAGVTPIGFLYAPNTSAMKTKRRINSYNRRVSMQKGSEGDATEKSAITKSSSSEKSSQSTTKKTWDQMNRKERRAYTEKRRNMSEDELRNSMRYSPSEKKRELQRAKTKDQFNIDFLETVQNTGWIDGNHQSRLLKEYEEYLDDPYKYSKKKLPQE